LNGCATSDSGYGHSKMDEHSAAAAAVQPVGSTNCEQTPPHHHHQQQEQQYTGNNDGDDRPRSHQLTQQVIDYFTSFYAATLRKGLEISCKSPM